VIIVTGGAGMIGSNIVAALNASGDSDILVVDDLTDGRKFANLADLSICDYMDREAFLTRVNAGADFGSVDAIFHQGACSATTEWNGAYMMSNNYDYSKVLFDYAQSRRIPYIYASSAATYGNSDTFVEARSNELPLNVYAYSKLLFDEYVRRRFETLTAPVVGLRYFNVYGPREGHKGAMASVAYHLFNQIGEDEKARLFGAYGEIAAGMQSRDFVHVEDVAAVNLWAAGAGVSGVFNCGSGRAQPFLTVAETMIAALGRGEVTFIDFPAHLVGRYQDFTQADLSNLRAAGCEQVFRSVETGVAQYARWLIERKGAGLPA
jgi:ADP-L-glycero-D-manno-heptose 6-epimerase